MFAKLGVKPRLSELWSDAFPTELLAESLYICDQHSILSYLRKTSNIGTYQREREYACIGHVILKIKYIIPSSQTQSSNVFLLTMQLK